jgi:hypothetical protein
MDENPNNSSIHNTQDLVKQVQNFGGGYDQLTIEKFPYIATNSSGVLLVCAITDKSNLAEGIAHLIKVYIDEREWGDPSEFDWFLENLSIEEEEVQHPMAEIKSQFYQYKNNQNDFQKSIPSYYLNTIENKDFVKALIVRDYPTDDPEELDDLFLWVVLETKDIYFFFGFVAWG